MIEYYKNGQEWGDGGIQEVINKIYRINKRDEVLNNFVKEAVKKIEVNKYIQSQKKLNPYS